MALRFSVSPTISRRHAAIGGFVTIWACGNPADRCSNCGMKIDPKSAFRASLAKDEKVRAFDSPRCALTAYQADGGGLRVIEFYSGAWIDGTAARFVKGSDVLGPMGADLIPVELAKVDKFEKDHGGVHAYALDEIDTGALAP